MSILEKIGFKERKSVGISISANNFIELVCIDKDTKTVINYASDNIKYNSSIREIIDYEELKAAVVRLFNEAGIDTKSAYVTLTIPNVYFGITQVEGLSDDTFIVESIQSEIEDLYIFKRNGNGPQISYVISENSASRDKKTVIYSAIQAKATVSLIEVFDSLGIELVRINTSYSSLFNAIQFCDKRFGQYFNTGERNLIILITSNSCSSFYFTGEKLEEATESPLAVKSFTSDEVYGAVTKISTDAIEKNRPSSVLIISEADEIDAGILSQRLDFSGKIDCLNKSINRNEQIIEVNRMQSDIDANVISYMTVEAIGAAAADYDEYPISINFVPQGRIKKDEIKVGNYYVKFMYFLSYVILLAIITAYILSSLLNFGLEKALEKKAQINDKAVEDINVFKKSVEQGSDMSNAAILPIITEIINTNKEIIDTYEALSADIPKNVYVAKFIAQSNGAIGILGESKTSEAVEAFAGSLRSRNDSLVLTKLSVNEQSGDTGNKIPNGYTFEIKTPKENVSFQDFDFMKTREGVNVEENGYPPPPVI